MQNFKQHNSDTKIANAYENDNDNVGSEPKGRTSKRVFQENKARQIFQQGFLTSISYPLIHTRTIMALNTCSYTYFSDNLAVGRESNRDGIYQLAKFRWCNDFILENVHFIFINIF